MMDILLHKVDEAFIRVECDPGIARELAEHLTFEVPGAKFSPAFKTKHWDGKIRLYNTRTNQIYHGLSHEVHRWGQEHDYTVESANAFDATEEYSLAEAKEFSQSLGLPFEPHDHQLRAFAIAIRNKRCVLVSPTASGKSLISYLITRYYDSRTLIIVPTISLVHQLYSDFADYGFLSDEYIHRIFGGQDKQTDKQIVISTWQSVFEMDKIFFKSFDLIIGDEAHLFKAKSLTKIMTSMVNTKYRFGLTGTLDGLQVNELVLEGLFGPATKIISSRELMDQGTLAELKIKVLVLNHPIAEAKKLKGGTYQDEIAHIISFEPRNKFIRNLTVSLKGNTLILYAYVEKHGAILYDMIREKAGQRRVFFVHGGVDGEEREAIRAIVEKEKDAIIVASYGVFSTGINIKNLHNVIFASPTKSRVRTMQSIGRGLRVSDTKSAANLFDISDNLTIGNNKNFTLNHLIERVKMYNSEGFAYEMHTIKLKESTNERSVLFKNE